MPSACYECGVVVDALRTPSRVIGARVVSICRDCASGRVPLKPPPITESIEAAGEVTPRAAVPSRWPRRSVLLVAGVAAIAGACLSGWALRGALARGRAQARAQVIRAEPPMVLPLVMPIVTGPRAPAPAPPHAHAEPAIASTATVFPLGGADHAAPTANGFFGAIRQGDRPGECGDGHCGIDLRAPEGTPVVAVRAGVVAAVNRDADGRGGRWVKLDHAGGVSTSYFHLETIQEAIAPGAKVQAGDLIATVGRTGVHQAPTHLHFAVTVGGVYVDPMKLMRSAVASIDL